VRTTNEHTLHFLIIHLFHT